MGTDIHKYIRSTINNISTGYRGNFSQHKDPQINSDKSRYADIILGAPAYTEIRRVIDRVGDPYVAKLFLCSEYSYV